MIDAQWSTRGRRQGRRQRQVEEADTTSRRNVCNNQNVGRGHAERYTQIQRREEKLVMETASNSARPMGLQVTRRLFWDHGSSESESIL